MSNNELNAGIAPVVLTDQQNQHAEELFRLFESGEYYTPSEVQERELAGLPIDRPELNVYKLSDLWEELGPKVKVRIPVVLRRHTEQENEVTIVPPCEGRPTVGGVLTALVVKFPGVAVLNEAGEVPRFTNVYRGDEDIRFLGGLTCSVEHGDVISIIPAVAGGA